MTFRLKGRVARRVMMRATKAKMAIKSHFWGGSLGIEREGIFMDING